MRLCEGREAVDFVHPFVGTENFGNTFPGAAAPFGMVQVGPDTGGQGGYDYRQDTIYGFSQTHLSAMFDRPFSAYGTWRGATITAGSRDAAGSGGNGALQRAYGNRVYGSRGYIPSGLVLGTDCVAKGGDNDCQHPASATLEYSAADAALALMAAGLGKKADAALFAGRGPWYRNLWDSSIGQFRPRTVSGTWLTPYDPVAAAEEFHEGVAYQYQWLVPQDPAGLMGPMGGRHAFSRRLDDFFAYRKLLTDPALTARTDWIASPYDYYAKPTYSPNNEPDLLAPYMYHWAGQPAKTATVVRAAMTLFTTGPDGMTGNDDLGTMSAWYVFSSLGLRREPCAHGGVVAVGLGDTRCRSAAVGQPGAAGRAHVVVRGRPAVFGGARSRGQRSLTVDLVGQAAGGGAAARQCRGACGVAGVGAAAWADAVRAHAGVFLRVGDRDGIRRGGGWLLSAGGDRDRRSAACDGVGFAGCYRAVDLL